MSLACVRSARSVCPCSWRVCSNLRHCQVSGPHWVCPCSWHMCFHGSTLLRLQVALQGNCLKRALGCMHFPGLSHSGSGSQVLYNGAQIKLGLSFVPFSGSCSSGNQVLGEHTLPRCVVCLITSPVPAAWFPGCAVGEPSQVCYVSSLGN